MHLLLICGLALVSVGNGARAEEPSREFVQLTRAEISTREKATTFGVLYIAQWASYFITQPGTIRDQGSFKNWHTQMFRPHFDHDGIRYNLRNHSLAGNYYYNYYRSHGYDKKSAVLWSIASSAAFEFTIETVTERPSIQDLYQTPILGSLLGMGLESLSLYFHSLDTVPSRILGYILNPFTLANISSYGWRPHPIVTSDAVGAGMSWEF